MDIIYGYERGTFRLPKTVYQRVKRSVRKEFMARRELSYELALDLYKQLMSKKGRGVDYKALYESMASKEVPMTFEEIAKATGTTDPSEWPSNLPGRKNMTLDPHNWIRDSLFPEIKSGEQLELTSSNKKPRKPTKKAFSRIDPGDFIKLFDGEVWIMFDEGSTVYWNCCQLKDWGGSRLRAFCRKDTIVKAFFDGIEGVSRWGSNGGEIVACDGQYVLKGYGKGINA